MVSKELKQNHAWVASHGEELAKYAGKWIAVAGAKVLAAADSLKELMANPDVRREKTPFVTKISMPEEAVAAV